MAKKSQTQKTPKIEFAPGCFDNFEGTQEELDQMIKEIQDMFLNKTPEEIKAMSRPLDIEELFEDDPELAQKLIETFDDEPKRNLQ